MPASAQDGFHHCQARQAFRHPQEQGRKPEVKAPEEGQRYVIIVLTNIIAGATASAIIFVRLYLGGLFASNLKILSELSVPKIFPNFVLMFSTSFLAFFMLFHDSSTFLAISSRFSRVSINGI